MPCWVKMVGETVEITVPAGKLSYEILGYIKGLGFFSAF